MTKNPFLNALAAALYVGGVTVVFFIMSVLEAGKEDTVLIPLAMLSLLVLSAASMGYIFLYQPLLLLFAGEKEAATRLFLKTVGFFALFTACFFVAEIFIGPLL